MTTASKTSWRNRIIGHGEEAPDQLLANPRNWRIHPKAQQDALAGVLSEVGWVQDIIVNQQTGHVVDGHLRVSLAISQGEEKVPVKYVDLSEAEEALILATLDPLTGMAVAAKAALADLLADVAPKSDAVRAMLEDVGRNNGDGQGGQQEARATLVDRFVVPPFSVLDARQGYWQERKRAWLALGIQGEAGRGNYNEEMVHPAGTATIDFYSQKRALEAELGRDLSYEEAKAILTERGTVHDDRETQRRRSSAPSGQPRPATKLGPDGKTVRGDGHGRPIDRKVKMAQALRPGHTDVEGHGYRPPEADRAYKALQQTGSSKAEADPEAVGTSVFDPVLAELVYRWFCPPGGSVLDPFAGGTPRGVVAGYLGHPYTGIDIRQEQVDSNVHQLAELSTHHSLPIAPSWITGDSKDLDLVLAANGCEGWQFDLVFTCPPYYDLEIYSLDGADGSAKPSYEDFLAFYRRVFAQAVDHLAEDRFLVVVVGEIRDKRGIYRNFVGDTITMLKDLGLAYYNEAILVTAHGSLPIRAPRAFAATRKLGKTHQNVLVFFKGDPKKATAACGEIEVAMPEDGGLCG